MTSEGMRANIKDEYERCRALFVSVLFHGVYDALRDAAGLEPLRGSPVAPRRWIGSRDFNEICDRAGFVGSVMAKELKTILADPEQSLAMIEDSMEGRFAHAARKAKRSKKEKAPCD